MNTNQEVDRIVQDWLEDRVVAPQLDGLRETLVRLDDTPQTRARFLGRWIDRGGGARRGTDVHDHPPNTNRRNRLMYSATGITAALAILALSVNVIDTEPAPQSAGAPGLIVAADGAGQYTSIQAAVDAAADGDTIFIQPGTYDGSVFVDKGITLTGDGPRDEIIIASSDGETPIVSLVDTTATLSGITLTGE